MPSGSLVGVDVKYDRESRASSVRHFPLLYCVKTRYIASWLAGCMCSVWVQPCPARPAHQRNPRARCCTDRHPAGWPNCNSHLGFDFRLNILIYFIYNRYCLCIQIYLLWCKCYLPFGCSRNVKYLSFPLGLNQLISSKGRGNIYWKFSCQSGLWGGSRGLWKIQSVHSNPNSVRSEIFYHLRMSVVNPRAILWDFKIWSGIHPTEKSSNRTCLIREV